MKDSITETTHIRCARAPLAGALTFAMVLVSQAAMADEAGVSFWLPGFFGSLAAAPQQPGWSLADIYYHDHVSAGGDVALAREFEIGKVPLQFSGTLSGSVKVPNLDIDLLALSYVSATPVLGGQLAVGMMGFWGRNNTTLSATLNGTITPPGTSLRAPTSSAIRFGDLAIYTRWRRCAGTRA